MTAGVSDQRRAAARAVANPVLTVAAKQVEEGDRLILRAAVKSPRTAIRATLQKRYVSIYGTAAWQKVKTCQGQRAEQGVVQEGRDRREHRALPRVCDLPKYGQARGVERGQRDDLALDPAFGVRPVLQQGGTGFGTTTINGVAYTGWGVATYSHTGTWESRFTPGRHCKSFKAVLGVADISADGSSGVITFTADDTQVYASPALTPGMSIPVSVELAKPYRLGIQLLDTTPGGTTGRDAVESWPVLGEPAFLCTGV